MVAVYVRRRLAALGLILWLGIQTACFDNDTTSLNGRLWRVPRTRRNQNERRFTSQAADCRTTAWSALPTAGRDQISLTQTCFRTFTAMRDPTLGCSTAVDAAARRLACFPPHTGDTLDSWLTVFTGLL